MPDKQAAWLLLTDIAMPIAAGYLLRRATAARREDWNRWLNWVINVDVVILVSALSLLTFWSLKLTASMLALPLLAGMVNQVCAGAGFWRARRLYPDSRASAGAYGMSCMLSNRNTAGAIAVFIFFGESGYSLARLFSCLNWVYVFLAYPVAVRFSPQAQAAQDSGVRWVVLLKGLWHWRQIGLLAMVAGAILQARGVTRPEVMGEILPWLVRLSAWGFLVPVGYSLEFRKLGGVRYDWMFLGIIKFGLAPLIGGCLAWMLGFRGKELAAILILCASPVAIQAVVIARQFALDLPLAMGAFLITQVIFLVLVLPVIWGIIAFLNP